MEAMVNMRVDLGTIRVGGHVIGGLLSLSMVLQVVMVVAVVVIGAVETINGGEEILSMIGD